MLFVLTSGVSKIFNDGAKKTTIKQDTVLTKSIKNIKTSVVFLIFVEVVIRKML